MGDSWQRGLQQGLQRLDRTRTERQRGDAASGSSKSRPATLLTVPPGTTPHSREQPAFADCEVVGRASSRSSYQSSGGYGTRRSYDGLACEPPGGSYRTGRSSYGPAYQQSGGAHGVGRSSYGGDEPHPAPQPAAPSNTRLGALTDWRTVHQSMPPTDDTLPAVVQTLAPHSDPHPAPRSSISGRSRAKGLSIADILNAEPVRQNSPPARVLSPRRKASPCNLAEDRSEKVSHDDISQPQPRSRDTEIDQLRGREIWSNHETQILKHEISIRKHGDSHVYHRASTKLGNVRSPSACWRKWGELTAAKKSNEKKADKIPTNNTAWPPKQYDGEPALEQYHGFLASGWNVIDANKLHVLKHLDRRIKVKTLVLELGRKYSEESIRDHLLILHDNGFFMRKPPSRPWTSVDKALYKKRREKGASEDELMRACIRTREEIQEIVEHWGLMDTVMSSEGHGKRKADERKEVDNESKRRRPK